MGTEVLELVPKKGLEPPHPCGYMDLNHARLPIPPLRPVTFTTKRPLRVAFQEEQLSILQALRVLSNRRPTTRIARKFCSQVCFTLANIPLRTTYNRGQRP